MTNGKQDLQKDLLIFACEHRVEFVFFTDAYGPQVLATYTDNQHEYGVVQNVISLFADGDRSATTIKAITTCLSMLKKDHEERRKIKV